jgi:hypothetical protein
MSFDNFISRFAGVPDAGEMFAAAAGLNALLAEVDCDDYDIHQDWREFAMPGATVIAQRQMIVPGIAAGDDHHRRRRAAARPRARP